MLDIPALRQLCEAATKGPWTWNLNKKHRSVILEGVTGMHESVLDFRRWGMSGATPRFRNIAIKYEPMEPAEKFAVPVEGREHHADWFQTINHPDAAFIATARTALPAALAEIESLRAELAAARAAKPVAFGIVGSDGEIDTLRFQPKILADEECARRNSDEYANDVQKIVNRRPFRVVPLIIPPGAGG